jgi:hypothetical protein
MPRTDTHITYAKTKIIIALIAGGLIIAGLLYWYNSGNDETIDKLALQKSANLHNPQVINDQKVADVAAIAGKTVSGTVKQRPDYVSEVEWQVLQGVTKDQPEHEEKLTNLVNKMLFIKKKQAWLAAGENTEQRRQLAKQLLEMIPGQLAIEAIDSATAKEMETKLNAELKSTL